MESKAAQHSDAVNVHFSKDVLKKMKMRRLRRMTKAERIIKYINNECEHCKANVDLLDGDKPECMNDECFEAHSYAIECIRIVDEDYK